MATETIEITLDEELIVRLDQLVAAGRFSSRSRAVHDVLREKLNRTDHCRLMMECQKLTPTFEQALAENLSRYYGRLY
jgi:Arc/MetJ-type ribon-helix-helix transcriptional regulator